MKLAAQLYTVRDFTQTPQDIYQTLKKVKEIGYNSVQVSGFGPIDPVELKGYLDELGLSVCATHSPYSRIIDDTEALIQEHKLWGCHYIGLGSMPPQFRSLDGYREFAKQIRKPAQVIRDAGLKFVYHNHDFEFEKLDGTTFIQKMADDFTPDVFGFLVDTFWVQAGGASPSAFIETYADYIDVIHLKDMVIAQGGRAMAEVGEGNMDFDAIKAACDKANVVYAAVEQDICQRDPFQSLAISLDNIKANNWCQL